MLNIIVSETSGEGSSLDEDCRLRNNFGAVDEVLNVVAKNSHLSEGSLESILDFLLVVHK